MSSLNSIGQLRHLDRSSSDFHDQLRSILNGKEYKQLIPTLVGEDLVWLTDYLDEVRRRIALPHSPLKSA